MTTYRVVLIPGDGIGPEICEAACRVVEATGVKIAWERHPAGRAAIREEGAPLSEQTLRAIRRHRVALKGPLETPIGKGYASINVLLRQRLNLFANLRPARTLAGIRTPHPPLDLVVIRENTEGLYSGLERVVSPGVVESIKRVTRKASTRIARYAFSYASERGRRLVTAIHKANIMKLTDGLFLDCARRVAKEYPKIAYREMIVDNACMQLVMNPTQFDLLLLENLYGDIISDLVAGLVGGLGVVPAANIGEKGAIFEAVHGTAPDIVGKNRANPIALILSAALMLDYLGERAAAKRIWRAVNRVLKKGRVRTPDLGGTSTTRELTDALVRNLK